MYCLFRRCHLHLFQLLTSMALAPLRKVSIFPLLQISANSQSHMSRHRSTPAHVFYIQHLTTFLAPSAFDEIQCKLSGLGYVRHPCHFWKSGGRIKYRTFRWDSLSGRRCSLNRFCCIEEHLKLLPMSGNLCYVPAGPE